jgi:cyclohexadieny/prephenate dehydrogenase
MDSNKPFLFSKAAFIGLGLIGSSLALALKKHGVVEHITGYAKTKKTRDYVQEHGIADTMFDTMAEAVTGADVIILCTPVGVFRDIICEINAALPDGSIVTDVGSVKQFVMQEISSVLKSGVHFIPAHPIAGTEHSGPQAGFAELFENRWCVLTPEDTVPSDSVIKIENMWKAVGANVVQMFAERHDRILSFTSHLPHFIAFSLIGAIKQNENSYQGDQSDIIKFSAGSLRDFTRIAASDPTMWSDIFLTNKEAILDALQSFNNQIATLGEYIRSDNWQGIFDEIASVRHIRKDVIKAGQDTKFPDFGRNGTVYNTVGTENNHQ